MISIRRSLADLEKLHATRRLSLECYQSAIQSVAQYAIELEADVTAQYRKHLEDLEASLATGAPVALQESQPALRGLLRDYRDKTGKHMAGLRDELASAAGTLRQIMTLLKQSDGDHETQLRNAIARLRGAPCPPGDARDKLVSITDSMEDALEQARKQQQLTIAQFLVEIRMLQRRVDTLESTASGDAAPKLLTREEMETKMREMQAARFALLLVQARGLLSAEKEFNPEVAAELIAAFARRLRNELPATAVTGRWSEEVFAAILPADHPGGAGITKAVTDALAGTYACMADGKIVRPTLDLRAGLVNRAAEPLDRILQKAADFLKGQPV